jgi:hypothetical protein
MNACTAVVKQQTYSLSSTWRSSSLIFLFILCISIFYHFQSIDFKANTILTSFFFPGVTENTYRKCNPLTGLKQYTVELDGALYPHNVPSYFNTSLDFNCLNKSSETKKILLWNSFFGSIDHRYGLGKVEPFVRHKCPVTNCELLNDKARLNETDLVLVHMADKIAKLPKEWPVGQRRLYV